MGRGIPRPIFSLYNALKYSRCLLLILKKCISNVRMLEKLIS